MYKWIMVQLHGGVTVYTQNKVGHLRGANDNSGVDRDERFNYSSFRHLHDRGPTRLVTGPISSPRLSMRIEYFRDIV